MFCNKCGKEIDDLSDFCKYCGNSLKNDTADLTENALNFQSSEKKASIVSVCAKKKIFGILGNSSALFGVIGFMLIALIGLIAYGDIYLFGGFDFTKVLCVICLITMILGILFIVIDILLRKNAYFADKKKLVFSIFIIIFALLFSLILVISAIQNNTDNSSSGSGSYEMSHDVYSYVYMKVSNVNVTHSGNYAYVSGTVTNTGTYQIKYVKVKAVCKDAYGNIVDTDWTYAVDSTWLNPGESKNFEMMVKDSNHKISTANVTVVND